MGADRSTLMRSLQGKIARIEGRFISNHDRMEDAKSSQADHMRLGIPALDQAFSAGAMPINGLHEIRSSSRESALATGFLSGLLTILMARKNGSVFWTMTHHAARETGKPYGPGLIDLGLEPERFIFASANKVSDALWAVEEALSLKELTAVICTLQLGKKNISLHESRRLQLRAEKNKVPVFLMITGSQDCGLQNAALTRWHITATPTAPFRNFSAGVGHPSFNVDLVKNRTGKPARALLLWDPRHARFEHITRQQPSSRQRPAHSGLVVSHSFDRSSDAA